MMALPRAGRRLRDVAVAQAVGLALLLACHASFAAVPATDPPSVGINGGAGSAALIPPPRALITPPPRGADFGQAQVSSEVRHVAHWAIDSKDNDGLPFVIVDKVNARVFVFDAHAVLQGSAPALLGIARGDGSTTGVGDQKMSAIRLQDRTTPAGRFVASLGLDPQGHDILWIDYDNAIALHRVVKGTPAERRAQRLDSVTPDDNRISYGCINVPVKFYEAWIRPAFLHSSGIVYVLPETRTAHEMFGSYDVEHVPPAHAPTQP
jgi:hypothetical protein